MLTEISVAIILIVLSIFDIKSKEIPLILIIIGIISGLVNSADRIYSGEALIQIILSVLPGILMIIVHMISPVSIGLGDGLSLIASELCLSAHISLLEFMLITMVSALVSLVLITIKRKNVIIPFLPFIAAGHILVIGGMTFG